MIAWYAISVPAGGLKHINYCGLHCAASRLVTGGERFFRAKALRVVAAHAAAWGAADAESGALAQLAVEKLLPLHVAGIALGQAGEVQLHQR